MRDYLFQAQKSLEVYLDRGTVVLEKIDNAELEEVIEILRDRKAAYYNFRAAEAIVENEGVDLSQLFNFQNLWAEIQSVDQKLEVVLLNRWNQVGEKVKKFQKSRLDFGKYRSGTQKTRKVDTPV